MLKTLPWRMMAWGCSVGILAGLLAAAFELDFPGEICEYNQATKHKDCTTYSILPFLFIKVGKTLNDYGVAITALATVAIAWFTLSLRDATAEQGRLTQQSIDLARDEFNATHRPRLIVREVYYPVLYPQPGEPFDIVYTVANIGDARARIIESIILGDFTNQPRIMEVRIQDGRNAIGDVTIEAGTAIELQFPYQFVTWGSSELNIAPRTGVGLFFVGHIIYTDDTDGMQRRRRYNTVFRRQYMPDTRRFYPVNDTELEYAD